MGSTDPKVKLRTYKDANALLGNRKTKKIDNNTYLERYDGGSVSRISLRLHKTNIIDYLSDGEVRVQTGGYVTVTTKDRLNKYSNAWITQRNFQWYNRDGSTFTEGQRV